MPTYAYRLVNVFAETIFGGNPLCVFEDARGLDDDQMQALALQFNLSETTFVLPSDTATKRVRIFTPTFEMSFAGHPTLGSAHVVRELNKAGDHVTLEMKAGIISVDAKGDRWTLRANTPTSREHTQTRAEIAAMLGLGEHDVLEGARWMNTGSDQLIIPLANADAVKRVAINADLLLQVTSSQGRSMAYVFAPNGHDGAGNAKLLSRFFFMKHSAVIEDPGTGSATANLGAWMLHNRRAPCHFAIEQGEAVSRPCHLSLEVAADGTILVGGQVIEIGRGTITLP
jgi:trans-2,3-dihydro-3-hydroxyanthranilate isomerase